jgi:hypothetical protein
MLFFEIISGLQPALYILCLASAVLLAYAVYGHRYGGRDTLLAFNLDDPVCFNPEFHHQFLKRQLAKLQLHPAGNRPDATVQLTKLQLSDRLLNVAIAMNPLRLQTQSPDEEISIASAHDVTLERVGLVPYVYGDDVSVCGVAAIQSRMIVARGNLRVQASRIEADGLLANGDLEILCPETHITRLSGFSYRFNMQPIPVVAQKAFAFRRYSADHARHMGSRLTNAIDDNSILTENIVCGGDIVIGRNVTIHGAVKVYGSMKLTGPVVFLGPVVINGDLDAPGGCVFMSDVVVKGQLRSSSFLVAGQPQRHAVCVVARQLRLKGIVAGSGTLVASEQEGLRHAA